MTPAARLQTVIELLDAVMTVPRPADTLASAYFRERRFIGGGDRREISTLFYDIMRRYYRLSWWLGHCGAEVTPRLLVLADAALRGEDVQDIFTGAKYAPAALSRDELKLALFLKDKDLAPADMPQVFRLECPDWAAVPLQAALGDGFESEMVAMHGTAPLDLRVNTLKATRDDVLRRLKKDGFNVEAGRYSPWAVRVFDRPAIARHPLFTEGCIEIQDEGSQMVAVMAAPAPGQQVVDFCAGAGGKTLALGAMMRNKGRLVAMDVLGGRLQRARLRFRRAGLHNVETRPLTSEQDKFVKRHKEHFDVVLTDVPCSGTGTWRRDPDKRFRQLGPGLGELVPLQKSILESASRMVKKGGKLVYATCSLLPEENSAQIEAFLAAHPEFVLKPASGIVEIDGVGDYLQLSPARHDTDGFFAAVLIRQ